MNTFIIFLRLVSSIKFFHCGLTHNIYSKIVLVLGGWSLEFYNALKKLYSYYQKTDSESIHWHKSENNNKKKFHKIYVEIFVLFHSGYWAIYAWYPQYNILCVLRVTSGTFIALRFIVKAILASHASSFKRFCSKFSDLILSMCWPGYCCCIATGKLKTDRWKWY